MKEHLIPQDITGYRFHIIGSMTLGQFAQILLGVALGFIFYKTNLPGIIRWPISITFALLGFGAAFVPIEERPLGDWIVNFAKALYKPTKFFWQKTPQIPSLFNYEPNKKTGYKAEEVDVSPIRKEKIQQFLQSVNQPTENMDEFDLAEKQQIGTIINTFQQTNVASEPTKQAVKPNLKTKTRKITTQPKSFLVYQQKVANNNSEDGVTQINQAKPITQPKPITQSEQPKDSTQPAQSSQDLATTKSQQNNAQPTQNQDLPFPNKPTQPNKVVGMILSSNDELVSNALVELKTENMQTITAVKSNALGQFQISQELNNGKYFLTVQKTGFQFNPQEITLKGEIVDPIKIVGVNNN